MNCPNENTLRAYVDAELNPLEISELKSHLQSCADCQARYQTLSAVALRVSSQLAALDAPPSSLEANPQLAFARFQASLPADEPPIPFFARLFSGRSRFAWAASLAAAILFVSLLFPATRSFRAAASRHSSCGAGANRQPRFHCPEHRCLAAASRRLRQIAFGERCGDRQREGIFSRFARRRQPGRRISCAPHLHAHGFTCIRGLSGTHAFHLTLDRSRLQDILDQSGRSDLLLPAALDGAAVSPSRFREEQSW